MPRSLLFLCVVPAVLLFACARTLIPNTDVEDTHENRQVVAVLERYRHAMEAKDVGGILAVVSARYFDDNGTPGGEDDLDFDGLRTQIAALEQIPAVRYEIRYRRVSYEGLRVLVDCMYTGSYRIVGPEGERWERRVEENRLVLAREDGEYKIVSGL